MRILFFFLTFLGLRASLAQEVNYYEEWTYKDLNSKIDSLLLEIGEGNLSALENFTLYLDSDDYFERNLDYYQEKSLLADFALELLKGHTNFVHFSLDEKTSSKAFQNYLQTHKKEIFYSEVLEKFCDTPLEEMKVDYKLIRPAHYDASIICQDKIKKSFKIYEDYTLVDNYFMTHEFLRTEENFTLLKENLDNPYDPIFYELYNNISSVRELIKVLKTTEIYWKKLEVVRLLEHITHLHFYPSFDYPVLDTLPKTHYLARAEIYDYEKISTQYEYYVDSLESIDNLHLFAKTYNSSLLSDEFNNIEDYYIDFLSQRDHKLWKSYAAMHTLLSFKNNMALRFGGAMMYSWKYEWEREMPVIESSSMLCYMEEMTKVRVAVKDENGDWTTNYQDKISKEHLLLYWYQHYDDYQWSDAENAFLNTKEEIYLGDRLTLLFDNLFNTNYEIAIDAYKELIEESPALIEKKVNQYKNFKKGNLSTVNYFLSKNLNKVYYLTELVSFCKENQHDYLPDDNLKRDIANYSNASPTEKTEIRKSIQLDDITKVEYQFYFGENDSDSLKSLIENCYSDHLGNLLLDEAELLLYLKKKSHRLLRPYHMNRQLKTVSVDNLRLLKKIYDTTVDLAIKKEILSVFYSNHKKVKEYGIISISLGEFLDDIMHYYSATSFVEFEPTDSSYELIFEKLKHADSQESSVLLRLIRYNFKKNMTPYLIQYSNINTVVGRPSCHHHKFEYICKVKVGDCLIYSLEQIYDFRFPLPEAYRDYLIQENANYSRNVQEHRRMTRPNWQQFAEENPNDYDHWGEKLYRIGLEGIIQPKEIEDISAVWHSKYFTDKDFAIVFAALKKIDKPGDLYHMDRDSLYFPEKYLKFFVDAKYNLRDQEAVIDLFPSVPLKKLVKYIKRVAYFFSEEEQQKLYYHLLYSSDRQQNIYQLSKKQRTKIFLVLKAYKDRVEETSHTASKLETILQNLSKTQL